MTDLVQELLELENVKVLGYKIQNNAIYIQVESTKSEILCKKWALPELVESVQIAANPRAWPNRAYP